MKKALIIAILAVFVAVCIILAANSNRESDETIRRIDSKIERCGK